MPLTFPRSAGLALHVALAAVLVCATTAEAQYFGRNTVQHEKLEFKILQTEHFDIYHYEAEAEAARLAARLAERWYTRLSRTLDYRMRTRQPLILYASQPHFRQTNAVSGGIGEGTGGVTESFKRRIVLPLGATLADTDHVIGHELVHAFQFAMTGAEDRGASVNGMPSALGLPLWFIEGMAEYLSLGPVDAHTAMWIRDAAAREELPTIDKLDDPDFFPYRYGHAFWAYVAGRWGDPIVRDVFLAVADRRGGPAALEKVLGVDLETLSADWHAAIATQYRPILEATVKPAETATPVVTKERDGGRLNVGPALSPDGTRLVFLSERDLFSVDVFVAEADTGRVLRKLVSTATDPHFDSLQFIGSAGSWHPDGRQFALAAIKGGQPALVIVDTSNGDTVREIELPELGEIVNPAWSPDGNRLAFSATKGGLSNIYTYDLGANRLRQLTDDPYTDVQPAWSPDGRTLLFASDRFTTNLDSLTIGDIRLARLDVESGAIQPIEAFTRGKHISPQWSPDGTQIYFIGNPDGISNVYRLDLRDGGVEALTNVQSGVSGITAFSPSLSVASRSGLLAFTVYTDDEYWVMTADADRAPARAALRSGDGLDAAALPPRREAAGQVAEALSDPVTGLPPPQASFPVVDYRPRLQLDFLGQPMIGVGVDNFGTYVGGGISAYFSDMLGNHQLGVAAQASGGLKDLGGQVQYLNRSHRWMLGGSVEYLPYRFGSFAQALGVVDGQPALVEQRLLERQTSSAVTGIAAYPFSRASRVEFTGGVQHIGFDRELETVVVSPITGELFSEETEDLPSPGSLTLGFAGAALVYDTSIFGVTSPILGRRFRVDLSQSVGSINYSAVLADFREYYMPFRPVTFAFRGMHFGRYGRDAEDPRIPVEYLGYPQLVRGYDIDSFEANECQPGPAGECQAFDQLVGSRLLVGNAEVRVPLWSLFGGDDFYGPVPVELAAFGDIGIAWDSRSSPRFANGTREAVRSVGAAIRVNAFGYVVAEFDYVRPLDRPGRGWLWQFTLQPGF